MRFIGRKRRKGFTLVELLIVVAILGILAAVVIPSVLGLMGRGSAQAYETDQKVIQLAAAAFYSDIHGGWVDDTTVLWGGNDTSEEKPGHFYPTSLAKSFDHTLYASSEAADEDSNNPGSFLLMVDNGDNDPSNDPAAGDSNINEHAIWMGLLVNPAGSTCAGFSDCAGTVSRDVASPLQGDIALYLQEMPQSAMSPDASYEYNGGTEDGGYSWVIGKNGRVFGAYLLNGDWYAGFGGSYP